MTKVSPDGVEVISDPLIPYAAERLQYNPDGTLTWLRLDHRRDRVGMTAGSISSSDGYVYIKVKGRRLPAHRIVFYMHNGFVPKTIDHKNRLRADNRQENLRACLGSNDNQRNQTPQSERTSKYKGVCWDENRKKWMAYSKVRRRTVFLGRYADEEDAAKAYDEFVNKEFGEFASPNFTTA